MTEQNAVPEYKVDSQFRIFPVDEIGLSWDEDTASWILDLLTYSQSWTRDSKRSPNPIVDKSLLLHQAQIRVPRRKLTEVALLALIDESHTDKQFKTLLKMARDMRKERKAK